MKKGFLLPGVIATSVLLAGCGSDVKEALDPRDPGGVKIDFDKHSGVYLNNSKDKLVLVTPDAPQSVIYGQNGLPVLEDDFLAFFDQFFASFFADLDWGEPTTNVEILRNATLAPSDTTRFNLYTGRENHFGADNAKMTAFDMGFLDESLQIVIELLQLMMSWTIDINFEGDNANIVGNINDMAILDSLDRISTPFSLNNVAGAYQVDASTVITFSANGTFNYSATIEGEHCTVTGELLKQSNTMTAQYTMDTSHCANWAKFEHLNVANIDYQIGQETIIYWLQSNSDFTPAVIVGR
ncbi:hypothetical protein [Thaumasiovibrio subtropicus]|uniref:hypothetical protein n=1 Tax=Thaumasiovibrio subtropicus TaxID=1891207 RepID=UPI000B35D927|nr:hypothetical protein [Thaumasiovibrio subtropicus]